MRVALFHPGAMGSRLAGQLVAVGHQVSWVPEGRTPATAERAEAAGLTGLPFGEAGLEGDALRALRQVWTRLR